MPEGDTLFRTAVRLRRSLCGQTILRAESPRRMLGDEALRVLAEAVIEAVDARGKHLLIRLHSGHRLHSHLGMHGSWRVLLPGERWPKPTTWAGIALTLERCVAICFSPKTLELLSDTQYKRHPYLQRLGPDLLDDAADSRDILARFRQQPDRTLGEAVMDQTIACGVGNVFKSELLFVERVSPFRTVGEMTDEALLALIERARLLLRQNSTGEPRRTRMGDPGRRHWVYGRSGEHCLVCGATIQIRRQGDLGRTTYWCAVCQS